jgi:hypothetical protein
VLPHRSRFGRAGTIRATPEPVRPSRLVDLVLFAVTAVGLAGVGLGWLAARVGVSPLVGLAAGLTPALFMSVRASLGDAPAFALALWGVVVCRRRVGWAALLFTLAALTREHTLVVPTACAAVAVWDSRRDTRSERRPGLAARRALRHLPRLGPGDGTGPRSGGRRG